MKKILKCSKSVPKQEKRLLTHLANNEYSMPYKTLMDKGIKNGSGAIESAHRTVIQKQTAPTPRGSNQGSDDLLLVIKVLLVLDF